MEAEDWTKAGDAARAVLRGLAEKRRGKKAGAGDEARPEAGARECAGRNVSAGLPCPAGAASRIGGQSVTKGSAASSGNVIRLRTNGPAEKIMRAALMMHRGDSGRAHRQADTQGRGK